MTAQVFSTGTAVQRCAASLFSGCLGRLPRASEIAEAENNPGCHELAARLFASSEFHSVSRYVAFLFPLLLERAPEFILWERYRQELAIGRVSPGQLAEHFRGIAPGGFEEQGEDALVSANRLNQKSPQVEAFLLYAAILNRESTPDERNLRAAQIEGGYPMSDLIRDFVSSAEFQGRLHLEDRHWLDSSISSQNPQARPPRGSIFGRWRRRP